MVNEHGLLGLGFSCRVVRRRVRLEGGPPRLGFTTELMFVIRFGSIPRTVNDDEGNGRVREGQSHIK